MSRAPASSSPAPAGAAAVGDALGWVAIVGLSAIALFRCVVPFNPDVHWSTDPRFADPLPEVGLTGAVLLDWLSVLVLVLAVVSSLLRGGRAWPILVGLWAVGLSFGLWHGWSDAESLRLASHWGGALALGLAAAHLADDPRWRRIGLAAGIALVIPLGGQALYQVGVEHPATIAAYEEHREEHLEARGWEEGSHEHLKFEERLYQLQATGRFALGNVLGTVMAMLALAGAGALAGVLTVPRWRKPLAWPLLLGAVVLLAMAVVVLTFSRGAILAVILGVAAGAVACLLTWWGRPRLGPAWSGRLWGAILLAVVVAALGAVMVRGLVGEPETVHGERSLLFRYHYAQAAASMWAERPLTGVGPGRFQQAYLMHKNPLNPEDVSDPHSVFVFYIAGLGLGGVAWTALLLGLLYQGGRSLGRRAAMAHHDAEDGPAAAGQAEPTGAEDKSDAAALAARKARWTAVGAIGLLAFGGQYVVELPRYWIDAALLWMLATGGWLVLAGWLSGRDVWRTTLGCVGLFAALGAMIAHAQIEMSLTSIMGPPLLLMFVGLAAGASGAKPAGGDERRGREKRTGVSAPAAGAAAVVAIFAIVLLAMVVTPVARQQSRLAEAAHHLVAGRPVTAADTLASARDAALPADPRIARREAQLRAEMAEDAHRRGDTDARDRAWAAALTVLDQGREIGQRGSLWRFEAIVSERAWQLSEDRRWLAHAVRCAEAATDYQPYDLDAHMLAADLAWERGQRERAVGWYRRALELHRNAYLDELRQLPPDDLARVEARVAENGSAGSEP